LSFFPAHDAQYNASGFTDLYHSIQEDCFGCKTVWDLYSIIVKEATTYLFRQENKKFMDLIEVYRWVTGKKVHALKFSSAMGILQSMQNFLLTDLSRLHIKPAISKNSNTRNPVGP
jgi:hypothetical protein